ncbi:cytochrome P450 [Coprinopsis sp. MPI-PUGE-AT-0042]|nr:cytochrome P450 [Coprinopsis sp. MPI-PUGE-AT-0042]
MTLLSHAAQVLAIYVLTRVVWLVVRPLVRKDTLAALPKPPGGSPFIGHLGKLFGGYQVEYLAKLDGSGLVSNIGSFLGNRFLLISDPKVLHHVLVKDQDVFEETPESYAARSMLFGEGLLSTFGHQHRKQRKMLNPVFSINHMRDMVPTFHEISGKVSASLGRIVSKGQQEIDIFEWLSRGALELIAQSGFGHSFDSLKEDEKEHPYITTVKLLGPMFTKTAIPQFVILPMIHKWNLGGRWLQRFVMDNLTWGSIRTTKDIVDVMDRTAKDIYEARKRALATGTPLKGSGKDILTILMRSNAESTDEDKLPDDEILAQISTFVLAGLDTTSSALCRFLWLLAKHQQVQDLLRKEIREAREQYGELNYDQLVALPYLDAVCRETLRLYPPAPIVTRTALKDARVPLYKPIHGKDGQELQELVIPEGTTLIVSIQGCNRAADLWGSDTLEFKPERWLNDIPKNVVEAKVPGVYSHLMTFIGGGRSCIGFKFSQLEMKIMAFHLLEGLKFSLTKKEIAWRSFGVVTPAVDLSKLRPELPLLVERAE